MSRFPFLSSMIALACWVTPTVHAQVDFNIVGREMAGMLQNSHYARIPLDEAFGKRLLHD